MSTPDDSVVREAQNGSRAAFELLIEAHQQRIYNYVLRIMGSAEDAHDFTQDTFLKAYVALPKARGEMNFAPWLYRIATNVCRDELRRRKIVNWQPWEAVLGVFHAEQVAPDDPEREALRQERVEVVHDVLKKLSHRHRLCLILRESEDLSCEEIGEVMGVSRQAVKSLLFRARQEFRSVYQSLESKAIAASQIAQVALAREAES